MNRTNVSVAIFTAVLSATAMAQSADPAPATPTTQTQAGDTTNAVPKKSFWQWGSVAVSGFADTAYSLNFNHPASEVNQLHNFDVNANQVTWQALKFAFEKSAEPVGFRIDVGFGQLFDTFHASDPGGGTPAAQQFLQGYVMFKPKSWKGVQVDVGKFETSAGAEVTDTNLNWNYSRGLLFALGPYYHVGIRTTVPIGKSFTAGVQLVNGWNNINYWNGQPTVGLTGAWTKGKVSWANNYYNGVEKWIGRDNRRHFYDTVLTITPNQKSSVYLTLDYGTDRSKTLGNREWYGTGAAFRYQLTNRFAFAPRFEWYNDADGVQTGQSQHINEVTMTGEMKIMEGLVTRLEWRRDYTDQPYFLRGNDQLRNQQNTFLIGFIYAFGPKK